jgi:hypothetical protein
VIVERRTFRAELGKGGELATLFAESGVPGNAMRVYLPKSGTTDTVVVENEYDSLAAFEQQWPPFLDEKREDGTVAKVLELTTGLDIAFFELVE